LLTGLDLKDTSSIESASREFQKLIMDSGLPPDLDTAITGCSRTASVGRDMTVSVRSSALAEDGHFSFAGQYATYLHVSPEDIPDRYLAVLSSLFTARALFYTASKGFVDGEMAMAVGVMCMVLPGQAVLCIRRIERSTD